jgi:NADH-quinone oxidoreductase subunit M
MISRAGHRPFALGNAMTRSASTVLGHSVRRRSPSLLALLLLAAPLAAQAQPRTRAVPRIHLTPCELSFTEPGKPRELTIKNVGTAPLQVREVRLGPGSDPAFKLDGAPTKDVALPPGKSLTVRVTYQPSGKAHPQAFGNVQVKSDDPDAAVRQGTTGVSLVKGKSYLLTVMVFFPVLALIFLFVVPKQNINALRLVAVVGAAVPFVLAVYLYQSFDRTIGMEDVNFGLQFVHHFVWMAGFNIEYYVGVDGISVAMVILTALVCLIAVGASWSVKKQLRGYFAMFLLLETGMMGVFCSLDFFLFYVFWEVMLLPMYFLIGVWGAPARTEADGRVRGGPYAAIKFFLYTLAGSVLMLLAMLALYYGSAGTELVNGLPAEHTFNLMKLTKLNSFALAAPILGMNFAKAIWIALFIGFAIKIPMFPFHTWLPDAHVEAPTAISVILAGVLLKMGTYGIFRINFQVLPEATRWAALGMAVFGVINILYGGLCAMAQKDLKKLVAYSSVSHMGFCLLGMAAFTDAGLVGAMFQMFNHGTITSMLFILVGVIYDRAHTRGVNDFGGLAAVMPRYAAFFGFAFMASLGLPGLSGFISEALVFIGAFKTLTFLVILAATGVVVTAAYHLWAIQRIHLGPFNTRWKDVLTGNDMDFREALTLVPLAIIVLVLGFYPSPVLDLVTVGMHDLVKIISPEGAAAIAMAP